ncbi:MAG: alanine--glyoxylate aminotransferase family protein [Chloroflexi bacterium]|nr:alanine--glyoxylate aminotransferase family protein [Chloroflexota bacterium]
MSASPELFGELQPPQRVLLGPGPSNVHPRVMRAMQLPVIGYLDPDLLQIMDQVAAMLRQVFRTRNSVTFAVPGTGSAGMETGIANLLEPDDVAVIGANGFFSERIAEMVTRQGARPIMVPAEWGSPVDPGDLERELKRHANKVKLLAVVHAETSTGVLQPMQDISRLARKYNALLLVDAVTSLGGCSVEVESWEADFVYSATQKCLGCPPGLSPITASDAAVNVIRERKSKTRTWYLDLSLLENYWSGPRRYHHTTPVTLLYALHEGLRVVLDEGLEQRFVRHERNAEALRRGLEALGLKLLVAPPYRLNQLTPVFIPDGIDDQTFRQALLREFNIEIGGGLGKLRGQIWRIGLMGESSQVAYVLSLLTALETLLPRFGYEVARGEGVASAAKALAC